jgi:hypothetical protein
MRVYPRWKRRRTAAAMIWIVLAATYALVISACTKSAGVDLYDGADTHGELDTRSAEGDP